MMAPTMAALPRDRSDFALILALLLRERMLLPTSPGANSDLTVVSKLADSNLPTSIPDNKPGLPIAPRRSISKRRVSRKDPSPFSNRRSNTRNTRLRVLVVDDVSDVTEMIGLFLKHAGYEVSTADSARAALELAGERAFDLIISDIGMPAMNGYELAEALRQLPEYQEIPLIAVTGYTEYDDRGRSLRAGFNAHMTKPIDPSQLLTIISSLLH
jgi:CheY-like chemotaxis protein